MQVLLVAAFTANSFAQVAIPATDGEVREFRRIFQSEIKTEMDNQHLQYEAIGIFSFINKLIYDGFESARVEELKKLFYTGLRHDLCPTHIVEAVRLGYGFDRGVCSDLVVSPAEMDIYRKSLAGIGKHVSKTSQRAERRHVFTTSASDATIAAHLSASNALTYQADEERAYVRFIYAPASIAAKRELEATVKQIERRLLKCGRKAFAGLLSMAALLDTIPPTQQAERAEKVALLKLQERVSNEAILEYLALPDDKFEQVNMFWDKTKSMSDGIIKGIKKRNQGT